MSTTLERMIQRTRGPLCPVGDNPVASPGCRLIVRLVLDVTKTLEGRCEGRLIVPETGAQHDFAGILELLAILEEELGPEDNPGDR